MRTLKEHRAALESFVERVAAKSHRRKVTRDDKKWLGAYNESAMRKLSILLALLLVLAAALFAGDKKSRYEEPQSAMSFLVLKEDNGKPVRNASVVLHFVDSHGKQERGGLELKTNAEGKASFDGVPYGNLRVQVLASGFQTFGADYEVNQPAMVITMKLKRPQGQYSIYDDHSDPSKEEKKPQ